MGINMLDMKERNAHAENVSANVGICFPRSFGPGAGVVIMATFIEAL